MRCLPCQTKAAWPARRDSRSWPAGSGSDRARPPFCRACRLLRRCTRSAKCGRDSCRCLRRQRRRVGRGVKIGQIPIGQLAKPARAWVGIKNRAGQGQGHGSTFRNGVACYLGVVGGKPQPVGALILYAWSFGVATLANRHTRGAIVYICAHISFFCPALATSHQQFGPIY